MSMLGFGSGERGAVGLLVELHEHEVPDLDVAVGRRWPATAVGTELGAEVLEDLRDGPQGPVSPICQKLSVAEPLDPVGRASPTRVAPDLLGLVVVLVAP